MNKPTDEELYGVSWVAYQGLAHWENTQRRIVEVQNRALHDAGIAWAADALEAEWRRLANEEGQGEFAAAALMCAATIRRLAKGGGHGH